MNGVTDGSIDMGLRTSPSLTSSERDRRLKARMAELADKSRAVIDGGGGDHLISPSSGTAAPIAAPRSTSMSGTQPSTLTSSTGGGGLAGISRYTSLASGGLDKGPTGYSSYRYTGFSSRLKSGYDQSPTGTNTLTNGPTSSNVVSENPTTLSFLTTKREMFFRDGPNTASTLSTSSSPSVTTNGTNSARDQDDDGAPRLASSSHKEKSVTTTSSSGPPTKEVEGYVGFAVLPNQVYRKAVKRGFEFTLMVVGESGLGKSTLINSMFLSDIYSNEYPGPSLRQKKTVQVETSKVTLKENGVNLLLTIVDTPGFGDAVDNTNCWQPVIDYIETQYEEYLNSESRVNRRSMPDNRVHSCIYFIAPSGHGLKPLDVEFIKRLQDKVNIIPVIAKADTMTPEECTLFKKTILNEITQNKIKVYEFPECDDEEDSKNQKTLKDRVPFAVVGSNVMVDSNGKKIRGRRYPWGTAEVENLEHCDFLALRNMLIRTHMQDLKDITNNVHYENYRYRRLAGVGNDGKPLRVSNKNPLAQMEEEKRDHESKMKKMEQDMEQVFEMKVKEKKQKLKDSEADLQRRHEQMKKNLEQQQKELEDKRKAFEKEKSAWEEANKVSLDDLRRRSLENNSKESDSGASSTTSSITSIDVVRKPSFLKLKRADTVPRRPSLPPPPPAFGAANMNDPHSQNCRQMQVDGKEKKKEKKKGLF